MSLRRRRVAHCALDASDEVAVQHDEECSQPDGAPALAAGSTVDGATVTLVFSEDVTGTEATLFAQLADKTAIALSLPVVSGNEISYTCTPAVVAGDVLLIYGQAGKHDIVTTPAGIPVGSFLVRPKNITEGIGGAVLDLDLDGDGKGDTMLHDAPGYTITEDEDSVNIDTDKDGDADIVSPK